MMVLSVEVLVPLIPILVSSLPDREVFDHFRPYPLPISLRPREREDILILLSTFLFFYIFRFGVLVSLTEIERYFAPLT